MRTAAIYWLSSSRSFIDDDHCMPDEQASAAPRLVLASASPRRARILRSLGISFRVFVSNVDESVLAGESARQTVRRLARAKSQSVGDVDDIPILGADTVVLLDGQPLGKPACPDDARKMLRRLSERTHEVLTGLCLRTQRGVFEADEATRVTFSSLDDRVINWYVASGEPLDKAGAYHIDGLGAFFVRSIQGSPSNVAGLPVSRLWELARRARVSLGPD
jgi:septum formation protein